MGKMGAKEERNRIRGEGDRRKGIKYCVESHGGEKERKGASHSPCSVKRGCERSMPQI